MLMGPFLDRYISANWVFNYDWNVPALTFLALSCACAVGVNISQFMCLGRFTAVSYQVPATALLLVTRATSHLTGFHAIAVFGSSPMHVADECGAAELHKRESDMAR